jgi:uncharacterized membrane protein
MEARAALTIKEPPDALYARWRDLARLPTFMAHVEAVMPIDERRSHWVTKAFAGVTLEWDAEIVEDLPGERIAWQSLEHSSVDNRGDVRFRPAPGGRGTEVHVTIAYDPPGGAVGAALAKLLGEDPEVLVKDDLRRLKQIVETGEIARSDGSPRGPRTPDLLRQRPARPVAEDEVIDLTAPSHQEVRT